MFNGPIPKGLIIDHLNGNSHDNRLSNLKCKTPSENNRNQKLRVDNKTGINGVSLWTNNKGQFYALASWKTLEGKRKCKCFSIEKLGKEVALEMAKDCRQKAIEELNRLGAGYTERHGT